MYEFGGVETSGPQRGARVACPLLSPLLCGEDNPSCPAKRVSTLLFPAFPPGMLKPPQLLLTSSPLRCSHSGALSLSLGVPAGTSQGPYLLVRGS